MVVGNVQSASSVSVNSIGETARSAKAWLGRHITQGARAIKGLLVKIGSATVDFFKSSGTFLKTGYGVGVGFGVLAIVSTTIAVALELKNKKVTQALRISLLVATALLVAGGVAAVVIFGRDPVSFSKTAI